MPAAKPHHRQAGQTIIEVLVAIGLAAIMLPALSVSIISSRNGQAQQSERLQASTLLREANEAVRSIREQGWTQLIPNGPAPYSNSTVIYHPITSGSSWALSAGSENINGYTRQIAVSYGLRSSSGALVASGGSIDPSTLHIVSTVSWATPLVSSVTSDYYLQRYLSNATWTQTTQADFNAGTFTNTTTTNTSGGEVVLAQVPGIPDWTRPKQIGADKLSGTATVVAVSGTYAYMGAGTALQIVDISNPAAPATVGSYTAPGTITGIAVNGNYVYLATSSTTAEVVVVNAATKTNPTQAATINLSGNAGALSIFYSNNYVYVTRSFSNTNGTQEFVVLNATSPSNLTVSGGLDLSANANKVFVSGNYAYIATSIGTAELTVVNVTNKSAPTQAGVYNTPGTVAADAVYVVGTTVYLGEAANGSNPEFFILNAANPAAISLIGSYTANGAITGIYVSTTYAYLSTTINKNQFLDLDLANPSTPSVYSNFSIGSNANDIGSDGTYMYLATAAKNAELTVIGPTLNKGYALTGNFTSSSFNAGSTVGFNYLTFTASSPINTSVKFQIATNTDNATWNYAGPDGTSATYYAAPAAIPLNAVSGRYIRYKAYFTSDGTATPVVNDVTVNYSP